MADIVWWVLNFVGLNYVFAFVFGEIPFPYALLWFAAWVGSGLLIDRLIDWRLEYDSESSC